MGYNKINVKTVRAFLFLLTNISPWELQNNLKLLIHEKKGIIHENFILQIQYLNQCMRDYGFALISSNQKCDLLFFLLMNNLVRGRKRKLNAEKAPAKNKSLSMTFHFLAA